MRQGTYSEIVQYQSSRELDYALMVWYENMRTNWDMDYLLSPDLQTPSGFFACFREFPLFLQFHNNEIVHAGWFLPFMGAAVMDFWVHPDFRQSKQAAYFLFELLQGAFELGVPSVIGWIQEREDDDRTRKFIRQHEHVGYEYSGLLKHCFHGQDCHVVVITQEGFEKSPSRVKTKWLASRG